MTDGGSARIARVAVVLSWALAAALATAVVWWAVAVIGGEQPGARDGVLSQARVVAELAAQAATSSPAPEPFTGPRPTASPSSPAAAPTTQQPAPAPAQVVRTWDVAGGQVGAACQDTQIALLYATPQDGWTVQVKRAGPAELEVEFRREQLETTVRAACSGGVPAPATQSGDG